MNDTRKSPTWLAWFVKSPICDMDSAARQLARDCEERGVSVSLVIGASEAPGALGAGQPTIVVADAVPSSVISVANTIVVASEQPPLPALDVLIIQPDWTPGEAALAALTSLEKLALIPLPQEEVYSAEEEERLRKALDDLGYL